MGLLDTITGLFTGDAPPPLPADKQNYIGNWQGETVRLSISPNGDVDYKQSIVEGSNTRNRSVTGPIKSFDGDSFNVGVLNTNTTFKVERAPQQTGDGWVMVLDGEELRRSPSSAI
ncbi:MAG: hypothetical protein H0V88_02105 [Pyrinomonadaceae bacterium]|nr:hypothetical protein [Pyrinomonadaceae bacterium]